ncbi:MAG: 50S ribosomal protein L6 [Clostridioides sp.]|jgi:large subunit ribosomal protein L6|nr:50S ribosomal protein L6 [Clostridioides sp.]
MSRIGLKPITVPAGVEVTIAEGNLVTVKGAKGTLTEQFNEEMSIKKLEDNTIVVERPTDNKKHKSLHGLTRTLINNMVTGVSTGFEKKLILKGVGYRAQKQGSKLVMNLGFSHPVEMEDPEGITVEVPNQTELVVKGVDKQLVGNYAAKIRAWRRPEPYKGKGIRYENEVIRRKEGKTGKK